MSQTPRQPEVLSPRPVSPGDAGDLPSTLPPAGGVAGAPDRVSEIDSHTHIPGYVLTACLGRGAYGQVWQAVRVSTGQDVAVKIFTHPGAIDWHYLQREVDLLLRVAEHPHIVTLLDANFQNVPPFYAMALLRSGSLAQFCHPHKRLADVEQGARWLEQIAQALEFAHGKGLLHCDIKPGNVLLDEEHHVRLADFGQSQLRGEAARSLGTLNYMAPEQAAVAGGAHPANASVSWDIYGLGATLYAVLSGQPPHSQESLLQTLSGLVDVEARLAQYRQHVVNTPIIPLRGLNRGVDSDLAYIIEHCLHPDPEARYRSIGELVADLQRRRAVRPLLCRPHTGPYVVQRFVRRSLGVILIALAGILALGAIGAIGYFKVQAEMEALRSKDSELELRVDGLQNAVERIRNRALPPSEVPAPSNPSPR